MILLGSSLNETPVVSIQTGGIVARITRALVNPAKLNIVAYEVVGPLIKTRPTYLRIADIRELSDVGAIVDSADELVTSGDVIAIDELEKLGFNLIGMKVVNEKRHKLGRITDYTIDMSSFYIQQLTVKRPILHSVTDTELLVHRTQIIEINNDAVVVHSAAKAPEPERNESLGSYVNPFRKSETATDSIEVE